MNDESDIGERSPGRRGARCRWLAAPYGRCALCALLGLVTSVAVAWGASARGQMRPGNPWRVGHGVAVVDETIVWMSLSERAALRVTALSLVDTSGPGPEQERYRELATRIREIGGAAYDAEEQASAASAASAPPMNVVPLGKPPLIYRIDDRAALGPPEGLQGIGEAGTWITRHDTGWPLPALRSERRDDLGPPLSAGIMPVHEVVTQHRFALVLPWMRPGVRLMTGKADPVALPLRPLPGLFINALFFGLLWGALLFGPGAVRCARRRASGRCSRCGYLLAGQPTPGCPECGAGRRSLA